MAKVCGVEWCAVGRIIASREECFPAKHSGTMHLTMSDAIGVLGVLYEIIALRVMWNRLRWGYQFSNPSFEVDIEHSSRLEVVSKERG